MKMIIYLITFTTFLSAESTVSNSEVFSNIYERGVWGAKGSSGGGSDPRNAKIYLAFLQNYLTEHSIESVVDLGCGDWRLGSEINWDGIQYLGIDVVDSVIDENSKKFSAPNISFIQADGIVDDLPEADLLICKDVLQHLPYEDIQKIIRQFSKFKHCMIVNDVNPGQLTCKNTDISRGGYRRLDLTKPPFSLLGKKVLTYSSDGNTKMLLLINN